MSLLKDIILLKNTWAHLPPIGNSNRATTYLFLLLGLETPLLPEEFPVPLMVVGQVWRFSENETVAHNTISTILQKNFSQ